jgi:transcriptional regulator with XRE-family HTH domain
MPTRLYVGIEHGESNATLVTLARLCEGLEVEVEALFARRPGA